MARDDFDRRRAHALTDNKVFEDVTVASFAEEGFEALRETIEQWAVLNHEANSADWDSTYKRKRQFEMWAERLKVKLRLRTRRTTIKLVDGNFQLVDTDDVTELFLRPLSLTMFPDGGFAFEGVHHSFYSWERNYNAGYVRENTYTTYLVRVGATGISFEITDTKRNSS